MKIKGFDKDLNTGHCNTGDLNTGYCNTGYCNTGDRNTGDCNTGDCNTGYWNTGDWNAGHWNTGDCNTGNWNAGYYNTGDCNTGDRNTGNWNTGNRNTGHWNTGHWNTGNRNTCSGSNGVFCTEKDRNIRIFNVPSGMSLSEFRNSEYYDALTSSPLFINGMGSIHSSGNGHRRKEIDWRVFKTTDVQRSLFTVVGEDVAREPGNCSANSEF